MPTKEFCVYNETQESLLSSRVSVIDTRSDPLNLLKVLMEGPAPNEETGLWLNPLKSVPTVPRISPYDLVFLDRDCRVIHGVELVPDAEVPHFNGQAASALVLPFRSFASSQTHPGDQVVIRAVEEMEQPSAPVPAVATPAPTPQGARILADQSSANVEMDPPLWGASFGQPQAPMQQLNATEIGQSLDRKSVASRFRSWRVLARLRVHISISIAPVPAGKAAPFHAEEGAAQWISLKSQCKGRSAELLHQCARPFIANIPSSVANGTRSRTRKWGSLRIRCTGWPAELPHRCTRLLVATIPRLAAKGVRSWARNYAIWKVEYRRWAEVFVYGPERAAARTAVSGAHGADFQAQDEGR
jgi:hypothetical protein